MLADELAWGSEGVAQLVLEAALELCSAAKFSPPGELPWVLALAAVLLLAAPLVLSGAARLSLTGLLA